MLALKLVALCCLGLVNAKSFNRIIGGVAPDATINYHCAILASPSASDPVRLGGGTIVSNRHVITVAHLLRNMESIRVAPATPDVAFADLGALAIVASVSSVHIHADFNATTGEFDVAVIAFPTAQFEDLLASGFLPTLPTAAGVTGSGIVVGFGFTVVNANAPSTDLYQVEQTVGTCPAAIAATSTHFCAASGISNLCPGDNGSGFVVNGVLNGIASLIPNACQVTGSTGYTDITQESILEFITSLVGPVVPGEPNVTDGTDGTDGPTEDPTDGPTDDPTDDPTEDPTDSTDV